jgi:uncharacterized protein YjiS (DUF1127 family)
MNIAKLVASTVGGAKPDHNFSHHSAHESEAGIFEKFKAYAKNNYDQYNADVREKRAVEAVLKMSDDMLRDIGLYHSDQDSLGAGQTSLEKLSAEREANRNQNKR